MPLNTLSPSRSCHNTRLLSYRCRAFLYTRHSFSYNDVADRSSYCRNQRQTVGLSFPDILSYPSDQTPYRPVFPGLPRSHPSLPVLFPSPGTDQCPVLLPIPLPLYFLHLPESHNTLQIHGNGRCERYHTGQSFSSYAGSTICIRSFSEFSSHTAGSPTSGRLQRKHPAGSLRSHSAHHPRPSGTSSDLPTHPHCRLPHRLEDLR